MVSRMLSYHMKMVRLQEFIVKIGLWSFPKIWITIGFTYKDVQSHRKLPFSRVLVMRFMERDKVQINNKTNKRPLVTTITDLFKLQL